MAKHTKGTGKRSIKVKNKLMIALRPSTDEMLESTGIGPQTPSELKSMAAMGAMMALFGTGDTLIRSVQKNPTLNQKMGASALQRMYNEADRMNHHFNGHWQIEDTDQMIYLFTDVAVVMQVLSTVDVHSRTNLADQFRRIWAKLLANVGDEHAIEQMAEEIIKIRAARSLDGTKIDPSTGQAIFDELTFKTRDGAMQVQMPEVVLGEVSDTIIDNLEQGKQQLQQVANNPIVHQTNAVVFVRDAQTKAFIPGATVHVDYADKASQEVIVKYDPDTLYERQYPTDIRVTFRGYATGYQAGGCEKIFYQGDPDTIVVNVFLHPLPTEAAV